MAKVWVRVLGILYGVAGAMQLVTFLFLLVYGPGIQALGRMEAIVYGLMVGVPLLNSIICILICYSFLRFRRWGRYLAIAFNSAYMAAFAFGFVYSRLTEPQEMTMVASLFLLAIFAVLGSIIAFCLRGEVKDLLVH